jgi:hypothetical protein
MGEEGPADCHLGMPKMAPFSKLGVFALVLPSPPQIGGADAARQGVVGCGTHERKIFMREDAPLYNVHVYDNKITAVLSGGTQPFECSILR